MTLAVLPALALDKPTGAPLVLSSIETEQPIPLATLSPDGKTALCVDVRLHWSPEQNVAANDDSTSFALDIPADSPGAAIFTAQLWNASLASAMAWQQPWQGARWKVLDTPATDGTGIDAALAVGMIATSARRPYPKSTLVIGSLKPDGTLGAVTRLADRLDAAAAAGISRVIIPGVQRFDVDDSGAVMNMVRHADDLHLTCVPVDNLVQATETAMNDPLPEVAVNAATPKYSNDVANYIDDFAHREQEEMSSDMAFAPREADLGKYPSHQAALWKLVYADSDAAQQAYRAGQVYAAYRLFVRANGRMHGLNALIGENATAFDVRQALADSDDLRRQLHDIMTPPTIDRNELESAVLVAEMADWAYDVAAEIEGAQLVTKQAFSQRSDATQAEKDRARQTILFANEEAKYLLKEEDFFTGLLPHVAANPIPVEENAAHLLPQLIPAQLATAEVFTDGIRPRANDLRDGLLFDPRLVAYINVLRETKNAWDARQRKKELDTAAPVAVPADGATKLNASATSNVGFDPGNTYAPPHTVLVPTTPQKKLSDVAACLVWVNNDCEISALDEKYLQLGGTVDPVTHEWHMKDRAKLDALLQMADVGARQGIAFAEKAEIDTSVLDMIYEKASQLRIENDEASALDALRNYWRCALLGNMCWQLAHTHKAQPVDLAAAKPGDTAAKPGAKAPVPPVKPAPKPATTPTQVAGTTKTSDVAKNVPIAGTKTASNPPPVKTPPSGDTVVTPAGAAVPVVAPATTADIDTAHAPRALPVTEEPPPATTNIVAAPAMTNTVAAPATTNIVAAPAMTNAVPATQNPVVASAPSPAPVTGPVVMPKAAPVALPAAPLEDDSSIPVAPVARTEDYTGGNTNAPTTNGSPLIGPIAPGTGTP
jgi:hypothetical protein